MKHRSFWREVQRAGVLLAALATAGLARAQPTREARLHLTTSATCVTETGIAAGVQQRSDAIVFVAQGDVPVLEVAVAERGRELQAELSVHWPDGRSARRTLSATSCRQLTAAVALVISMTLDPAGEATTAKQAEVRGRAPAVGAAPRANDRRAGGAARAGNAPTAPGSTSPNAADAGGSAPVAAHSDESSAPSSEHAAETPEPPSGLEDAATRGSRAPAAPTAPGPAADGGRTDPPASAADGGETSFFQLDDWSIGAQGALAFGIAPRALPGVGGYLWLAWHGAPPWSPALRLDFSHAWLDDYAAIGGKASFELDAASLELCPVALRAGPFAGHACGDAQLGALSAAGADTYHPTARTRLWSAFGGALLASARVTSWAEVQVGSALRAPPRRDRFAFAPDVFHRVGWLTLELHASLGVRFP